MAPAPEPAPEASPAAQRPLLGPIFWTLLIFGLLCVLAGAAVATLGPKLFPAPTSGAARNEASADPAAAGDVQVR